MELQVSFLLAVADQGMELQVSILLVDHGCPVLCGHYHFDEQSFDYIFISDLIYVAEVICHSNFSSYLHSVILRRFIQYFIQSSYTQSFYVRSFYVQFKSCRSRGQLI
jgi:hypothetical protein